MQTMIKTEPSTGDARSGPKYKRRKELSFLWRIPENIDTQPEKVERALRERIKELNCLYGIARLADRCHDSLEDMLRSLVDFLPLSWQYPDISCARIIYKGQTFKGDDFKLTKWRQSAQILLYGEPVGEAAIFYLEERPAADEGPFLKEERALLDEVAERIGAIAMRMAAERELQEINEQLTTERGALKETNAALRAILARIEEEKQVIYRDIHANIEKIVMPILHALSLQLPKGQRKYVELLRENLGEITSPFIGHLSQKYHSLTPTEVTICNMIKSGMRTKEIAELRGISFATVNRHREHIRRKLQIKNSEINLATHLQSIL
jgi:DNA-binding CsgD family transcriptional regulator